MCKILVKKDMNNSPLVYDYNSKLELIGELERLCKKFVTPL